MVNGFGLRIARGARFKQKALITKQTKPGVVHAEHAWWFPEQEGAEPNLFGTFTSNLNNMTEAYRVGQGGIGSAIKSMLCKIYPVQEGDILPGDVSRDQRHVPRIRSRPAVPTDRRIGGCDERYPYKLRILHRVSLL